MNAAVQNPGLDQAPDRRNAAVDAFNAAINDFVNRVRHYMHVEDHEFSFLYQDAEGFHFMNQENYEQLQVPADVVGDYAPYLQEGMVVSLAIHEGIAVSMTIPQKVTLEIVETEPAMKGQTASGSFKPAILSNGVRTMVPTHIVPGTRVVVMTADGAYVERAKD